MLSTQLTADLPLECCAESTFRLLLYTDAKSMFNLAVLSFENYFLMNKCSWKLKPICSCNIFKVLAISCNCSLWFAKTRLLIYLCHHRFCATGAFDIIGVCTTVCKVSIPFLYYLSRYNYSEDFFGGEALVWTSIFLIKSSDKSTGEILIDYFQNLNSGKIMIGLSWNVDRYCLKVCTF